MTFVLVNEHDHSGSYKLVNLGQVTQASFENMKDQERRKASLPFADGSNIKLQGREIPLVLDTIYGTAGIGGYDPSANRPR